MITIPVSWISILIAAASGQASNALSPSLHFSKCSRGSHVTSLPRPLFVLQCQPNQTPLQFHCSRVQLPKFWNVLCPQPPSTPTAVLRIRHHHSADLTNSIFKSYHVSFLSKHQTIRSNLVFHFSMLRRFRPYLVSNPGPANPPISPLFEPPRASLPPPIKPPNHPPASALNAALNIPYLKFQEVTSVSVAKWKIHHMIIPGF